MDQEAEPTDPTDKSALRRLLRAQRRSLAAQRDPGVDDNAIATAASGLLDGLSLTPTGAGEHPAYLGGACVAIYRSLPVEPPTQALEQMLHARHVTVIVPETLPDFDLEWRELRADGSEGPRLGLAGIGAARLILAPALSVDHTGTRLGQGGGCYDRALERRRPEAVVVAIVNDLEYVAGPLPFDAHDVRVDGVITPARGFCEIPGPGSVA
jgi:5-formyltetrahydrofolate cyclo-ligase